MIPRLAIVVLALRGSSGASVRTRVIAESALCSLPDVDNLAALRLARTLERLAGLEADEYLDRFAPIERVAA